MRIGQFTASLQAPHGGAEQYCLALTAWLLAAGHQCVVYTREIDHETLAHLEALGARVEILSLRLPYRSGERGSIPARLAFHAVDFIRALRPLLSKQQLGDAELDVLHVHRWQGFGVGALQSRTVPVIHTVHDFSLVDSRTTLARDNGPLTTLPLVQSLRARVLHATVARRPPTFVFPSKRTRDRHLDVGFDLRGARSHVVPHGWELEDHLPPSPPSTDGKRRVVFLGSLSKEKGIPLLLDAWGDGIDDVELLIAGSGPLTEDVATAARRSARVQALGWVSGASRTDLLRGATLLVLPSIWPETFSLVSAEALLAGRPVVTTERGRPEFLSNSDSIVAPHSASALRQALTEVLRDPDALRDLQNGAARSARLFDVDRHLAHLTHIYESADSRPLAPQREPSIR